MLDAVPQVREVQAPAAASWRPPRKKAVKDKRLKMGTKEMKMELLMAFREKPEWATRDLADRLHQATDHIAKVIGEIADYDQRARVYRIKKSAQLYDEDDD
jgi:hypothetical protein